VKSSLVNDLANARVEDLVQRHEALRLAVRRGAGGARIIDAGVAVPGGLEAGRRIAEICLGGLGTVTFRADAGRTWLWQVDVHSSNPVLACLGSQYAGWSLAHGEGKQAFHALGSGPGRLLGSREALFDELGCREQAPQTCLVLEVDREPPPSLCAKIAEQCGIEESGLTLILTPTSSLAGAVQITARVLETALHKAHALGFPLDAIVDGAGSAQVCPPSPNFLTAMSRTNDAILFAGRVQLFVAADNAAAEELAQKLPSSASADYGRPFGEIFKGVKYDFYQIDPMLFSPAQVTVTSLSTGHSFHAGRIDTDLLDQSFSGDIG